MSTRFSIVIKSAQKCFYNESCNALEIETLKMFLPKYGVVMNICTGVGFLSEYSARVIDINSVFAYEANPFMIHRINHTFQFQLWSVFCL